MKVSKLRLTNYQIERILNEFNTKIFVPGISAKYSYFIYKNTEFLAEPYNKLMNELYDERKEPNFQEMVDAQNKLIMKYADRDEQGNIIKDENNVPVINENIVEFNNENDKLIEKYKELFDKIKKKDEYNHEIRSKEDEYDLVTLDLSEFPDVTPPFIVGLLNSENVY